MSPVSRSLGGIGTPKMIHPQHQQHDDQAEFVPLAGFTGPASNPENFS